ncbi:ABC transporter permease [Primorskyibacter marinus]|uniref:ABC transporter permease n=1 Tax=Primorskyibacter marinus TaxID=1977320 RepID=UPI000E305068|nr:ABC transporter permease [Primorskyibacter marinus]
MSELFQEAILVSILAGTVRIMTPILFAAIGELVTQRAGIWNMGVEGTMLMGAFTAYIVATATGSIWLAVLASMVVGGLVGLLTAFMTATMRVDHFITGLGINLLVAGLTLYWFRIYIKGRAQPTFDGFENVPIPVLSSIPWLGEILFSQRLLTYVAFAAVPAIWFLLYRTRWGLELRCLGENPKALDIKGLSVTGRQYIAVLIGSVMTGLGGGFLMLGFSDRYLADITAGRGWLAIVAIIAGNWLPRGVLAAVLVFALLESIATHVQVLGLNVPHQIFLAMPYLASILLLMGLRRKSSQPLRLGIPYFR